MVTFVYDELVLIHNSIQSVLRNYFYKYLHKDILYNCYYLFGTILTFFIYILNKITLDLI